MNINLHIEQLALDGLPLSRGGGESLKAALQTELTRLFAESPGISWRGRDLRRLSLPAIALTREFDAAKCGRAAAGALRNGLVKASAAKS